MRNSIKVVVFVLLVIVIGFIVLPTMPRDTSDLTTDSRTTLVNNSLDTVALSGTEAIESDGAYSSGTRSTLGIGLANPAAAYCKEMGYQYEIVTTEDGEEGIVTLPNGEQCDEWAFYNESHVSSIKSVEAEKIDTGVWLEGGGGSITTPTPLPIPLSTAQGGGGGVQLPCAFHGTVQVSEANVADGTVITATIGNETYTTTTSDSTYRVIIVQPEGKSYEEMTVTFMIDSYPAAQTGTWQEGGNVALNLTSAGLVIPSHFDWRNKDGANWMTPVKDQGDCGSCWAFSAVGTVEAQYDIFYKNPNLNLDLSEQYLVSDCDDSWWCIFGLCSNCRGGFSDSALAFIRDNGIPDEACYPYIAMNSSCARCPDWSSRLKKIDYVGRVQNSIETIKQYLIEKGPLSAYMGINRDVGGYFDSNGIYRATNDSFTNHAVVIVGYDEPGQYWIVKNSWGTGFGENGYFKVGFGECGIESSVYYATLNAPAVITGEATNISTDSATLNGSLTSLGTASSVAVSFQWATTAYYTSHGNTYASETFAQTMSTPGVFLADLTDLTPNTTYQFRSKAVGEGTSYGADIAFATTASQPPSQLPCAFHGTVQLNGASVADGTIIMVMIGNDTYTTTTPSAAGASTYRIVIAQPQGKSYDGMNVAFMVGDAVATQTATWTTGSNILLNITAFKSIPTVTPTPTSTPTPTLTPTPTPTVPPIPTPTPINIPGNGTVEQQIVYSVLDGQAVLTIGAGTTVLTTIGGPLQSISMEEVCLNIPQAAGYIIGCAYDFKPNGATFNPAATLTLKYDPGMVPSLVNESMLVIAYYDTVTSKWIVLPSTVNTVNHTVTAQVSDFTLFSVYIAVTPGSAEPTRHLPSNPQSPGQTFDVTVTFMAPQDNFNSIAIRDDIPTGWAIQSDITWCTPNAYATNIVADQLQYVWFGPYSSGQTFTVLYKVTVPIGASAGSYIFDGQLAYYIGDGDMIIETITGDQQVQVVLTPTPTPTSSPTPTPTATPTPTLTPSTPVTGITREVNGSILPGVSITLGTSSVVSDQNGHFEIMVETTGNHELVAHKDGFRDRTQTANIQGFGPGYAVTCNFQGQHGLIPKAPDIWYALDCVNRWLYPPNPDIGLDIWTALDVINAWLYPVQ